MRLRKIRIDLQHVLEQAFRCRAFTHVAKSKRLVEQRIHVSGREHECAFEHGQRLRRLSQIPQSKPKIGQCSEMVFVEFQCSAL